MADGLTPSASSSRRGGGPPPPPRGAVDSQPSLLSPSAESPVDELLALVAAEADSLEGDGKDGKKKGSAVSDATLTSSGTGRGFSVPEDRLTV